MPKTKLFVDQTIEINAPAPKVWEAITRRENSDLWTKEFSSGGPNFHIESDWRLGSPVQWKGQDGTLIVNGTVTALLPNKLLRFTVFDVRNERKLDVTEKDGITFEFNEANGKTELHVLQGDFSVLPEGKKYRDMSDQTWTRVLPIIKKIAENNQ